MLIRTKQGATVLQIGRLRKPGNEPIMEDIRTLKSMFNQIY